LTVGGRCDQRGKSVVTCVIDIQTQLVMEERFLKNPGRLAKTLSKGLDVGRGLGMTDLKLHPGHGLNPSKLFSAFVARFYKLVPFVLRVGWL